MLNQHLPIVIKILTNHIAVTAHNKGFPRMGQRDANFVLHDEAHKYGRRHSRSVSGKEM